MGCDIHIIAEEKIGNEWVPLAGHSFHWFKEEDGEIDWNDNLIEPFRYKLNHDRNYELFGILAGVRREAPFILYPDEMHAPDGLSEFGKILYWQAADHTRRYFDLDEFLKIDFDKYYSIYFGVLNESEYKRWKKEGGYPISYRQSVAGRNIETICEKEYIESISIKRDAQIDYYIACEWTVPYAVTMENFIKDMKAIRGLTENKIRILFGFDS